MTKLRIALAATAATAFALLGLAAPAQSYPDVTCTISDPGEVCEGESFTLTASVDPDVECHPISITWNGQTREGTGSSLEATFETEEGDADREELETSEASCTYDFFDQESGQTVDRTVTATGQVDIVECDDDDDDGDGDDSDDSDDSDEDDDGDGLPDTGGERLLWLLIGLLLVAGGTAVIISSRREDEAPS